MEVLLLEQIRQHLRDHSAILRGEAQTRRRLHAIGEDVPFALGVAPEIGRRQQQRMRVDGAGAGQRSGETGVAEHDSRWHDAFAHEVLRSVEVDEQRVQQLRPLREADLQRRPPGRVEHERHGVQLPRLRSGVTAQVGDAVIREKPRDLAVDTLQILAGEAQGVRGQSLPRRAQRPVGIHELVVTDRLRRRRQRQRRLRHRRGIVAQHTHGEVLPGSSVGGNTVGR